MKNIHIFPILLLVILFTACVEDCISTKTNNMSVEFYRSGTTGDDPYPVNILEARMDATVLFQDNDSLQRDTLQLNPTADQVRFSFDIALYDLDTVITGDDPDDFFVRRLYTDTVEAILNVNYERRQRVISEECGVEQSYNEISIVQEGFDSVRVVNKNISRINLEDVDAKLYL